MRIMTIATAAALAVAVALPADAAKRHAKPMTMKSFEECESLAIQRGVPHGQTGHSEFVAQCMGREPRGRQTPPS